MTARPGYARAVILPALILSALWIAIGLLCIATMEKKGDSAILNMCWNSARIVVPLVFVFLNLRWAWRTGIVTGERTRGFFGLRSWFWPVAALLLVPAAIFVPRPADLKEPAGAMEILRPMTLITPEGGSYRFVAFEEWQKFNPVYAVTLMKSANQSTTRTLGWDSQQGASFGFFRRSANWTYQLTATRFDWKSAADGPVEIAPAERAKLRPLVVAELNRREIGRGARLEQMLDHGAQIESAVCWQNLVVLLAWLSLPLGALALFLMFWHTLAGKIVLSLLATCILIGFVLLKPRHASVPPPQANVDKR
jgi:hypothetical protein